VTNLCCSEQLLDAFSSVRNIRIILQAQLDLGDAMKVQQWKDVVDQAADLVTVWIETQKELMDRDHVKEFIAQGEVPIAAERV